MSLASAGLLCSGCPADENAARAEAARISFAIDGLRSADNESKPERLRKLREESCTDQEVCAVRSACLAAYELHVGSLDSVQNAVALADAGDRLEAATALDTARKNLDRARELTEECTRVQGELVRKRKLR